MTKSPWMATLWRCPGQSRGRIVAPWRRQPIPTPNDLQPFRKIKPVTCILSDHLVKQQEANHPGNSWARLSARLLAPLCLKISLLRDSTLLLRWGLEGRGSSRSSKATLWMASRATKCQRKRKPRARGPHSCKDRRVVVSASAARYPGKCLVQNQIRLQVSMEASTEVDESKHQGASLPDRHSSEGSKT